MSEYRFSKENGSFYLRCNGHIVYMADTLAFLVDRGGGISVLLKHGPTESINAYFAKMRARYIEGGLSDMLESIVVVEARDWPVEEINRFLDTTGYIGRYLDRLQADDKEVPASAPRCTECGNHLDDCNHFKECATEIVIGGSADAMLAEDSATNSIVASGTIDIITVGDNRR